jgi:peptidoglycan/xylan/chitin deacetylase (PgdA/CDA1 family)
MIRTRIKSGAAHVLNGIGMHGLGTRWYGSRDVPVVIAYHRVVEDFDTAAKTSIPSQLVSLRMLERHLDWIGRRFKFVTLDEAGRSMESGGGSEAPTAALTFDDGYRDFYDLALPLLQKKGIPSAIFVVTDLVGTKQPQAHDKLYLLLVRRRRRVQLTGAPDISRMSPYEATRALIENLSSAGIQKVIALLEEEDAIGEDAYRAFHSLDWEALRKIQRAGVTVGSHTKSHALLPGEPERRVGEELTGSREEIERRLQAPVRHFAYPSGQFNPGVVRAVAEAGYRYAYTGCPHRSKQHPLLTIPRAILWENSSVDADRSFSSSILHCQLHHTFSLMSGCRRSDHAERRSA